MGGILYCKSQICYDSPESTVEVWAHLICFHHSIAMKRFSLTCFEGYWLLIISQLNNIHNNEICVELDLSHT